MRRENEVDGDDGTRDDGSQGRLPGRVRMAEGPGDSVSCWITRLELDGYGRLFCAEMGPFNVL